MQDPFVVAFVVGVTPSKWARIWGERMSRPLELRPLPREAALAALADGSAHVALVRLPDADLPGSGLPGSGLPGFGIPADFSAIPLYTEAAVVVAPKDHPVTAFESLTLDDLAGEVVLGAPAASGGSGVASGQDVSGGLEPAVEHDAEPDWAGIIALVAANVGVAVMPQPVARALGRRDVTATPITGTPETRVGLVWVTARQIPETEEFIGIVRGRTANSSRGAGEEQPKPPKASNSRSGTPSRRDPRASRARRR